MLVVRDVVVEFVIARRCFNIVKLLRLDLAT